MEIRELGSEPSVVGVEVQIIKTPPCSVSRISLQQKMQVPDLPSPVDYTSTTLKHQVRLNRQTVLGTLIRYPLNTTLDYPGTTESVLEPIGHLFQLDPDNWANPMRNIVYSLGAPNGATSSTGSVKCFVLLDIDGAPVPCKRINSTCT